MTPVIEIENFGISRGGHKILSISNFHVDRSEVLVLIGPNGSGKTTLLMGLSALIKPVSGVLLYDGQPVNNSSAVSRVHRRIAAVFQEPLLLDSSVRDNVTLGLGFRHISRVEMTKRADRWLERFGILHLADRQARTLSGGEAKRTSLARAFAIEPEIVFLDEAFNGLDTPTRQAIVTDFQSVLRETRVTTVMVTHDSGEAMALADRIIVLIGGEVRQTGSASEIFCRPVDEEVAAFVETGNILRGTVKSSGNGAMLVAVGPQTVKVACASPANSKVSLFVRYDDVSVATETGNTSPNSFSGRITSILPSESQVRIKVDCGFPVTSLVSRHFAESAAFTIGRQVTVSFSESSPHIIPSTRYTRSGIRSAIDSRIATCYIPCQLNRK
jgi:tungstate transport system ATP-binding protein